MGSWDHVICVKCFFRMNQCVQTAGLIKGNQALTCCFCLIKTNAGIRFKAAPEIVPCRGHHDAKDGS